MREFPDRFTGIGKFPGEYKIRLHPDAHLVIHTPRKCLIALCPKVKEHLAKMEALGSNHPCRPAHRLGIVTYLCTKGKQWASPMSRSTWPQQSNLPQSPQDTYCRRSCTWIHKFALLHQAWPTSWILVNSPWWRIKPPNYLQQPIWEVLLPVSSHWSGLLTGHLPEEDGPVPQRVPWMYQNCQWHQGTWSHWGRTWCLSV